MIEISENYYKFIKQLEESNCNRYDVVTHQDHYYINGDTILQCLDDTQDCREYAEHKLQDIIEDYEERRKEDNPNINDVMWYKEKLSKITEENERLKEENEELKETNEIIKNEMLFYCNEDDLDRLADQGVAL